MKQKYFVFVFLVISFLFISCEEENYETNYKGIVVNAIDHKPFADLEVCVTNGENTYKTTHTDAAGSFEILVRSKEINSTYYLLVGDSSCAPVRKDLRGLGKAEIDLGVIEVEGPKAPVVTTDTVFSHKAGTAVCQANVVDGGRSFVSVRGVCWSTKENPTIYDNQKESGTTGEGKFEVSISDLRLETTYYFRAYARNRIDVSYGKQIAFTTGDGKAVIETDSVFAITATSAKCAGNVIDEGDFAIRTRGICWSLTPDPTTSDSVAHESAGTGPFVCSMRNLAVSTPYYVRTFVVNESNITTYGEVLPFETKDGKPKVSTDKAVPAATSIVVTGTIIDNGGFPVTERGVCYSTSSDEPTIAGQKEPGGSGNGTFNVTIEGLSTSTTYYLRAYAKNTEGTSYGKCVEVITLSGNPDVSTGVPSATATSISVSGTIIDNGGFPIKERGVCYSTSSTKPTVSDPKVTSGKGDGTFNVVLEGLSASTKYYMRAYAINENGGIGYGESKNETTLSGKAKVILGGFANVSTSSASCAVTIQDNGGADVSRCGICWSSSNPNPTIEDNVVPAGGTQTGTSYTCNMSGLSSGMTYNVCAFATTSVTTEYSTPKQVTTLANVSGTVKSEAGQVIPYASITFKQGKSVIKTVTANVNGSFSLQIAPDTYTVIASAQGYSDLTKTIYVDTNPIELIMKQLGILCGTVYDDDNIPLANVTVSVNSSVDDRTYSAVSGNDGTYRIENVPLGMTSYISVSCYDYTLKYEIPNRNIVSGVNNLDIVLTIYQPVGWPESQRFDCTSDGQCGTVVTRTFQIKNNRQKSVTWSMSGMPANGFTVSPTSGTIPAKSSVTITATFKYPGPSVPGSVKTTIYNCTIGGQKYNYTYLWNWSLTGMWDSCTSHCSQDINVVVGQNTSIFSVEFFQYIVWR